MINPDEVKDKFYDDLDSVISAAPRTDKLILLGGFNARVGTDHQTWEDFFFNFSNFSLWEILTPGAWPIWTPGAWLDGFM